MTSMLTRGTLRSAWWGTAACVVLGLAVAASGWGALAVAQGPGRLTTYAGSSGLASALTIASGAALGVAGLVAAFGGSRKLGVLALLAGILWFAPEWVGWEQGPLLVRSIGMVAAGYFLPIVVHVVLAHPRGRPPTLLGRAVVVTAYVEATIVAITGAALRDPFFDPYCWANCTGNVFVVSSLPELSRVIVVADQWFTVALAVAVLGLCTSRVVSATPPARRSVLPVAAAAVPFAVTVGARGAMLVRRQMEDPVAPAFHDIFVLHCSSLVLLAAALVWGWLRIRVQYRTVSRIGSSLGEAPAPGALEAALGRTVGDPTLRIAYWLPGSERYVDASGRPTTPPATSPGRVLTTLVRDDQPVAVVSHAGAVPEIGSAMGAAFTLALDNERLQAEGLAQVEELRASRSRIVETGDLERRRLERDLHDGAQQRLLAASYEIRLATSRAAAADDVATASLLAGALDGAQAALDELRALAEGLYPAILGEAGLAAALTTMADTARVAVVTRGVAPDRYPAAVEAAAYHLVLECVEDAVRRQASVVTVEARRRDGVLVVAVEDDSPDDPGPLVRSADRIGALGGTLEVGPRVRAEIPCA